MHLRSRAVRTATGLTAAALVLTGVGAAAGVPSAGVASAGLQSSVSTAASAGDRTLATRAAGQRATITVLPPITQPGKGVARSAYAKTAIAVRVTPVAKGRPIRLERRSGTSWVKAGAARLNERGLADFAVATTSGGLPITYRAVALKHRGKAALKTAQVVSTQWGAPDFVDEFVGRKLGDAWSHRAPDYNPDGLRRCSKGSPKAVQVRRGAVRLSVMVDKSKGGRLCTAKRGDGSTVGRFKYRLNGHISTDGLETFRYGVAAARMKFQKVRGQHASFWLQPDAITGAKNAENGGAEVDIVEWFGHPSRNGGLTSFVYHPTKKGSKKVGDFIRNPEQYLSSRSDAWWKKYHVFSVEWTPRAYIFRIDGQETWRTTAGISGIAQYPILSLLSSDYELPSLGGERRLPQHMYVDWVQFWQRDSPL